MLTIVALYYYLVLSARMYVEKPDIEAPLPMTAPLTEVLVKRPGPAFGAAFDDPAHGFLHPVDLGRARREHDAFVETLASLGPRVHLLDAETASPDLVYQFDPLLVSDRGSIPLRPGKANRLGSEAVMERWLAPNLGYDAA